MGTNYHADFGNGRIHLGKMSAAGGGKTRFTWAADPVATVLAIVNAIAGDQSPLEGCTAHTFLTRLRLAEHDYTQIGEDFC